MFAPIRDTLLYRVTARVFVHTRSFKFATAEKFVPVGMTFLHAVRVVLNHLTIFECVACSPGGLEKFLVGLVFSAFVEKLRAFGLKIVDHEVVFVSGRSCVIFAN